MLFDGVTGSPPEYVGLGVVPLDGSGGGDAGPRFAGLPEPLGGALLTPTLGSGVALSLVGSIPMPEGGPLGSCVEGPHGAPLVGRGVA